MIYYFDFFVINGKKYITKINKNESEVELSSDNQIQITEDVYNEFASKISFCNFNKFLSTRYYFIVDEIKTKDDVLYDETPITDYEELNRIKEYNISSLDSINTDVQIRLTKLQYDIFKKNQVLLLNNYIITDENKDEKIDEIMMSDNQTLIDAIVSFSSNVEKYNNLVELLEKIQTAISDINKAQNDLEVSDILFQASKIANFIINY